MNLQDGAVFTSVVGLVTDIGGADPFNVVVEHRDVSCGTDGHKTRVEGHVSIAATPVRASASRTLAPSWLHLRFEDVK